jgi:hypothetical protein
MPHKLGKLQLYGFEDVWLQEGIKGFADQAQGEYVVLITLAQLHVEHEDRFEELAG